MAKKKTAKEKLQASEKKKLEILLEDVKRLGPKAVALWRDSHQPNSDILTPEEFFDKLNKPVDSKAHDFFKQLQEEKVEIDPSSTICTYDLKTNNWRWQRVKNAQELREAVKQSEGTENILRKLREGRINSFLKKQQKAKGLKETKEDFFGGSGFSDDSVVPQGQNISGYEIKHEYTPLLGTPFFKQMYLYDYLLMHAKTFWYKNYSGPAKLACAIYRNFVIGEGFSVSFDDKDKEAKEAWERYEERSGIHEKLGVWHDELFQSGELMLEKKMRPDGIVHESIDPSTIWEIVTDPENISDIKYYHQQYPTQYQIFGDKNTPLVKYILRQIPPELVHHVKVNVTSWEKRGRSDLLAALLYLKYFDDYIGFKLQRTKAEAAYFWDVMVKGDASDVSNYITTTQSIVDIAPGSENVHNEAIERKPIMPSLSHTGSDEVAKWILSYIFMSVCLPTSYAGTLESTGSSRASALVSTEPVTKLMEERRGKFENLLHKLFEDVMIAEGLDPKTEVEFNFPELIVEDRSKKLADMYSAYQEQVISHQTMSEIVAKELNINTYDYDDEQNQIQEEFKENPGLMNINLGQGLTQDKNPGENEGGHAFDRQDARDSNTDKL